VEELDRNVEILERSLKTVRESVEYLKKTKERRLTVMHSAGYKKAEDSLQSWSDSVWDAIKKLGTPAAEIQAAEKGKRRK
jgi:hypothetical protein